MLGTVLFNVLINGLEERLACNIVRFAGRENSQTGRESMQRQPCLHNIIQSCLDNWDEEWDNWDEQAYRNLTKLNNKFNVLGMRRKEPVQLYRHCPAG